MPENLYYFENHMIEEESKIKKKIKINDESTIAQVIPIVQQIFKISEPILLRSKNKESNNYEDMRPERRLSEFLLVPAMTPGRESDVIIIKADIKGG